MKAHAKIRINIYINIDAIGKAEYFLRVLWKKRTISTLRFDFDKHIRLYLAQCGVYLWEQRSHDRHLIAGQQNDREIEGR